MKKKLCAVMTAAVLAGVAVTACSGQAAETTAAESASEAEAGSSSAESADGAADAESADQASDAENASENGTSGSEEKASSEDKEAADASVSDTISDEELAGLYEAVAESAKLAVKDKSMDELAELVGYPCYVGIDGGTTVNDEAEFLSLDPSKIFTDAFVKAIEDADLSKIEVTEAGYVVGDPSGKPNITIGLDESKAIGITGINVE